MFIDKKKQKTNEVKEQKGGFLSMLLGTLGASLLGNLLEGKGLRAKKPGKVEMRAGERTNRFSQDF